MLQPSALLLAASTVVACNPCGNEILEDVSAPGGREHAVLFYRSCGAMGPGGFQVSTLPIGHQLASDRAGNLFDVNLRPRMHWISDTTLRIEYTPGATIEFQAVRLRGVYVEYDPPVVTSRFVQ